MVSSKAMKPGFVKALKLGPDKDDKEPSRLEKGIMKFFSKIERFCFRHKIWIVWRLKALDHLSDFPLKTALRFIWSDFVRTITFRHFRQQFASGWAYFKQGYEAYDFDSAYAMHIFLWKLERLAKVLEENDRHYGDKENAKKIKQVITLINRVMEDEYIDEFEKEVTEKYGESIHYSAKADDFMNHNKKLFEGGRIARTSFSQREEWTPENHYDIIKAERKAYRKAHNKRQREWRRALKIIEENFFEWWD